MKSVRIALYSMYFAMVTVAIPVQMMLYAFERVFLSMPDPYDETSYFH